MARNIEGDVVLSATIAEDGRVRTAEARSGPTPLIQPALDAVRQWRYQPKTLDGRFVEIETTITVRFLMHRQAVRERPRDNSRRH